MSIACPSCSTPLPDGAKFCLECGTRLAAPAQPAPSAPARRERRVLTVMFADLAGFTAASDRADVEDVHARVTPWQDLVRRVVAEERGTVARVLGDGLMVVWGYPVAREDDALRAVRAGIRILEALPGDHRDLHARIGVNTGEALVAFGSALEDADDAMGDAVNVAARLQSVAALDTMVVGEATARLVGASVSLEALAPLELKGKTEPVAAFRAVSLRQADSAAPAHLPMIGRDGDLEVLRADLRTARRTVVRRLVTGEAGIGKTRLLAELRRVAQSADPQLRWHIGRCRDEQRVPGLALADVLKAWAGISDDDGPTAVQERLDAAIGPDEPDRAWLLDRLAPLVGLDSRSTVDPAERETAWIRLLGLVASAGPTVIVIEDLHWADDATVSALANPALENLGAGLAVLMTSRPEAVADVPGPGSAGIAVLALEPLDREAAAALAVAAGTGLDPARAAAIAERGGGNPLFTAELVRLQAQQGDTAVNALPETVHAVIAARLDLLDTDVRDVARRAAVVGPVFWPAALEAYATPVTLGGALRELQAKGMIRSIDPSPLPGQPAYGFRHALIRDVAYGQLTRAARVETHASSARWLVGEVPPERGDLAGVIADHYAAALDLAAAGGFELDSAIRGEAVSAMLRAAGHSASEPAMAAGWWLRALELLDPDDERRWSATASAALALNHDGRSRDAMQLLASTLAGPDLALDAEQKVLLLNAQAAAMHLAGEDSAAVLDEADALLATLQVGQAHVDAAAARASWENRYGSRTAVIEAASRAVAMAGEIGVAAPTAARVLHGYATAAGGDSRGLAEIALAEADAVTAGQWSQAISAGQQHAIAHMYLGRYEAARRIAHRSADQARARGLGFLETRSLFVVAIADYASGRWEELMGLRKRVADAATADPSSIEPAFLAVLWRVLDARGDADEGAEVVRRLEASHPEGSVYRRVDVEPIRLVDLARSGDPLAVAASTAACYRQDQGELDPCVDVFLPRTVRALVRSGFTAEAQELTAMISAPSPLAVLIADTMRGTLALAAGDAETAAAILGAAADRWDAFGCLPFAAEARIDLGDALVRLGRRDDARTVLARSQTSFELLGARRHLDEIDVLERRLA